MEQPSPAGGDKQNMAEGVSKKVELIDLDRPEVIYQGELFLDMVRPGVRLPILGAKGCMTSVIQRVVPTGDSQYYLETKNSHYILKLAKTHDTAPGTVMPIPMEYERSRVEVSA